MSFGAKELILKVFQEHFKGLVSIGSIDVVFLTIMGWAYIEKGDICYSQWLLIFKKEAYFSALVVVTVWLITFLLCYRTEKKKRVRYVI